MGGSNHCQRVADQTSGSLPVAPRPLNGFSPSFLPPLPPRQTLARELLEVAASALQPQLWHWSCRGGGVARARLHSPGAAKERRAYLRGQTSAAGLRTAPAEMLWMLGPHPPPGRSDARVDPAATYTSLCGFAAAGEQTIALRFCKSAQRTGAGSTSHDAPWSGAASPEPCPSGLAEIITRNDPYRKPGLAPQQEKRNRRGAVDSFP